MYNKLVIALIAGFSEKQNTMQSEKAKDCKEINNVFTKLDESIRRIVEKEGYVTYKIEKNNLSDTIGGYTGTVFAINITGNTKYENKVTNIFAKQIVSVEIPIYDVKKIYKRETFMYTNIFKEMCALQEKENVPVAERFKTAKPYDECNNEEIILENLVATGFESCPKTEIVELDYAELVVKHLARLHGVSLAMSVKQPDYFKKKIQTMDCVYVFSDFFHRFRHEWREYVMQFLDNNIRERVAPHLKDLVDKYPSYMNDASCCVKTICHGDFRHSNIMVKKTEGSSTDVIAVDYQITFYGNPVLDLIYFIFWGTDQEFRRNHLVHLKQLYYQYLGTFLGYFNIEIEDVFPKKEFEKQYKEKLDFGLMIAMFYLPHLFPPKDDVCKTTKPLKETAIRVGTGYIERFTGIVDDFIHWGYLESKN